VSTAAYVLSDRELVLDRYRPLKPLGRGGSGSVWLARDERSGLEVALKIVPREGKRAQRAMREMEAASRLRHERCVRAYDFGGDDGHVYIAYEFVQGRTLREFLRTGKLTDRGAVEAASQVLDGLAHAHQRGIVHRDVKPSNVLVEDGPRLSIRLLDFGLAQFDEADTLTALGDVPGTLAYIAPERLGGGEATAKSDVWAVGVMLWEALASRHPFWGVPLPQVASTIAAGAPPLARERPDLPRRLVSVIDRALSIDPDARPTARRLAHELREALRNPDRARERHRSARRQPRPKPSLRSIQAQRTRLPQAAAAAFVTAGSTTLLPFWPGGLAVLLAIIAGVATLRSPRLGVALALFALLFPLGNVAQGAALAYGGVAILWLALTWRDPRAGLAFAAGPVLIPLGLIGLLPLAAQVGRGAWRRGVYAGAGVLAAVLVAGLRGDELPLAGGVVSDLGIRSSTSPLEVVEAAWGVLAASSGILVVTGTVAGVALLLPFARRRGRTEVAALASLQTVTVLAFAPGLPWLGVALGSVVLAALLVLPRPRFLAVWKQRRLVSRPAG
jgi:hypothetical protein